MCSYRDCALSALTTVVSTALPGRAVIDAGSKTLAYDRLAVGPQSGFGYVVGHPEVEVARLSEEHGWLDVSRAPGQLRVGDRLQLIPNHVCPTVNLHDRLYGYRGDEVVAEWPVAARGRVQ